MMFVEVLAPPGSLSDQQRRQIGERFVTEVMHAEGAPAAVIEAGQAISHVVFADLALWTVGGRTVGRAEPPRYLVRATVPESWREEMSAHLVRSFTRILADVERLGGADGDRLYRQPVAWVHVLGVPEGSCGCFGEVMRSVDIVKLITEPYRSEPERHRPADLAPGTALDPVCGMTVGVAAAAAVVERDGTTYAFCSRGCHEVFVSEEPAPTGPTPIAPG